MQSLWCYVAWSSPYLHNSWFVRKMTEKNFGMYSEYDHLSIQSKFLVRNRWNNGSWLYVSSVVYMFYQVIFAFPVYFAITECSALPWWIHCDIGLKKKKFWFSDSVDQSRVLPETKWPIALFGMLLGTCCKDVLPKGVMLKWCFRVASDHSLYAWAHGRKTENLAIESQLMCQRRKWSRMVWKWLDLKWLYGERKWKKSWWQI